MGIGAIEEITAYGRQLEPMSLAPASRIIREAGTINPYERDQQLKQLDDFGNYASAGATTEILGRS